MAPTKRTHAAQADERPVRTSGDGQDAPSPEERLQRIATAAYFRAEARGFAPGGDLDDWLEAEKEYDAACVKPQAGARPTRASAR